jgi:hypothetical protein
MDEGHRQILEIAASLADAGTPVADQAGAQLAYRRCGREQAGLDGPVPETDAQLLSIKSSACTVPSLRRTRCTS